MKSLDYMTAHGLECVHTKDKQAIPISNMALILLRSPIGCSQFVGMLGRLLGFCALWVWLSYVQAGAISPRLEADRYGPVELTFYSTKDRINPYLEVDVTAHIQPPPESGEPAYDIPGFWDGGNVWRVRWVPRHAGTYSVGVTATDVDDAGLHGQQFSTRVGSRMSSWAQRGFVEVDPNKPHALRFDDGTRFWWLGDTQWINLYEVGWGRTAASAITEDLWRKMVDHRRAVGFTVIQCVVWNGSVGWLDGVFPFDKGGKDLDRIDPRSWQRVDERIRYAVWQGLLVNLMLSSGGEHFRDGDWTPARRERLLRYVVARYAAYNVAFGGGEEIDMYDEKAAVPDPQKEAKFREFVATLHRADPYHRLVGLHGSDYDRVMIPDAVDIVQTQYGGRKDGKFKKTDSDLMRKRARQFGKPFINAETAYFSRTDPDSDLSRPETFRRLAWRVYMAGVAGYTYGNAHWVIGGTRGPRAPPPILPNDIEEAGVHEMRKLALWKKQVALDWADLTQFRDLGEQRALAFNPGRLYLALVEDKRGAPVALDLTESQGKFRGRWFDIARGEFTKTFHIQGGRKHRIVVPGPWNILHLTRLEVQ